MLYQLRQKLLAFGDDYIIRDADGNDCFFVDGKVFALGDKLSFQDMQGNELARIRQRLLALGKTYEITIGDQTTVVHKHLFTLFRCTFSVDVPGPNDLEAVGSLLDMEYEFRDTAGRVAATVSKRWFSIRDTYGIEISGDVDPVTILASAIVIDLCCHGDKQH
jgi:uncharacterized protein YxjI